MTSSAVAPTSRGPMSQVRLTQAQTAAFDMSTAMTARISAWQDVDGAFPVHVVQAARQTVGEVRRRRRESRLRRARVHRMFLTADVKRDRYRSDPRFADLLARCGFTTMGTRAGSATAR